MKRIIVGLLAVCLLGSLTVLAKEKATAGKTAKKEVALQDMTVTGKLTKNAKAGFSIMEADGTTAKIMMQKAAKKGETAVVDPVVDLEKWIGKEVKLLGKGTTKTIKAGKTKKTIKTVTSVEEAAAPATEAPAAK